MKSKKNILAVVFSTQRNHVPLTGESECRGTEQVSQSSEPNLPLYFAKGSPNKIFQAQRVEVQQSFKNFIAVLWAKLVLLVLHVAHQESYQMVEKGFNARVIAEGITQI